MIHKFNLISKHNSKQNLKQNSKNKIQKMHFYRRNTNVLRKEEKLNNDNFFDFTYICYDRV